MIVLGLGSSFLVINQVLGIKQIAVKSDIKTGRTPKRQLIPQWSYLDGFRMKDKDYKDKHYKDKQKKDYDERHRARPLDLLLPDTPVWIRTEQNQTTGYIRSSALAPRSYIVTTSDGRKLRRTR